VPASARCLMPSSMWRIIGKSPNSNRGTVSREDASGRYLCCSRVTSRVRPPRKGVSRHDQLEFGLAHTSSCGACSSATRKLVEAVGVEVMGAATSLSATRCHSG
jgi:hypothetical protein